MNVLDYLLALCYDEKNDEETPMNSEQLNYFRKKLQKTRKELLSKAEKMKGEELSQPEYVMDMADLAAYEADRNYLLRLRDRERKLIYKIDRVLDKIEKGDFGICIACGDDIDFKRLEARPMTDFCIECKTKQEKEEKKQAKKTV